MDESGKEYRLATDGLGKFQVSDAPQLKQPEMFGETQTSHEGERVLRETLALLPGETKLVYLEIIRKLVTLTGQGDLSPESEHVQKRVEQDLDEAVSAFRKYVTWGEPDVKVVSQLSTTLGGLSADLSDAIEMERREAARAITAQSEYVKSRRLVSEPRLTLPSVKAETTTTASPVERL